MLHFQTNVTTVYPFLISFIFKFYWNKFWNILYKMKWSVVLSHVIYKPGSKYPPPSSFSNVMRLQTLFRTFWHVLCVIYLTSLGMEAFRSLKHFGLSSYILSFSCPQRKKSYCFISGDCGGHCTTVLKNQLRTKLRNLKV